MSSGSWPFLHSYSVLFYLICCDSCVSVFPLLAARQHTSTLHSVNVFIRRIRGLRVSITSYCVTRATHVCRSTHGPEPVGHAASAGPVGSPQGPTVSSTMKTWLSYVRLVAPWLCSSESPLPSNFFSGELAPSASRSSFCGFLPLRLLELDVAVPTDRDDVRLPLLQLSLVEGPASHCHRHRLGRHRAGSSASRHTTRPSLREPQRIEASASHRRL